MNHKYDNSERLETVSDKQWREALDELTAYLRWRLCNKQTFFVLFFVKLFVHFAGHFRGTRADAGASALGFLSA